MKTLHCPRCGTSVGNATSATCANAHVPTPMVAGKSTGSVA